MDYGFEFIKDNGITSESNYPYTARDGSCQTSKQTPAVIPAHDLTYTDVQRNSADALENALNVGPVSIAIEADQRSFQLYQNGVFQGPSGDKLDHGVLVVGYGTDQGSTYWTIKNSWGDGWGESGYIRFA